MHLLTSIENKYVLHGYLREAFAGSLEWAAIEKSWKIGHFKDEKNPCRITENDQSETTAGWEAKITQGYWIKKDWSTKYYKVRLLT